MDVLLLTNKLIGSGVFLAIVNNAVKKYTLMSAAMFWIARLHHHRHHHHLLLPRPRHARHIVLVRGINTVISITIVIAVLYTSHGVVFLIHMMEPPKDVPI